MASTGQLDAAWAFHEATKYVAGPPDGPARISMGVGANRGPAIGDQDPAIEPYPYKVYTSLSPIPLPREFPDHPMPALTAIAATGLEPIGDATPDLADIARLCLLSNGLLKTGQIGQRVIEFRAAGGTGARYHLELYIVCGDLPGLAAGVYHYAAHDHTLRQLRTGDHRAHLVAAAGGQRAVAEAPATLVCTSVFWRNAWRYQARAYRHTYWDAGTTFANLLAVAASANLPARVAMGYADAPVNAVIDVDGRREAAIALLTVGRVAGATPAAAPAAGPLNLPTRPVSAREIEFPEIPTMHGASSLTVETARDWPGVGQPAARQLSIGPVTLLRPLSEAPALTVDAVIGRRRSVRHYDVETPIPFDKFSTILDQSVREFATDWQELGAGSLYRQYLIVNNVAGLEPGAHVHNQRLQCVELLRAGDCRAKAQRLACRQQYASEAHVNVYWQTDLRPVLARYGARGYRVAQLEAAISAGKLHLAAHAVGLGAVGSTSYDDEVTEFFAPHAADTSFMFVLVFGKRRPRASS